MSETKRRKIMGIRLGHKPVIWDDAWQAVNATDASSITRVYEKISDGGKTHGGWSFDYPLEEDEQ